MAKIKVLLHTIFYPCAIGRYFERALLRRSDVELKTVGIYTGAKIPWEGGMNVNPKYAISPDFPLSSQQSPVTEYNQVKVMMGGWKPDVILTVDAGSQWRSKPDEGMIVHVATDSHCLDYDKQRGECDVFYNMHEAYAKPHDCILPYAYDPSCHYPEPDAVKEYDVSMVGVKYSHRIELASRLQAEGIKVYFSNGEIFDEYRQASCKAHIGINWSSLNDLNARAFEIPAMGLIPVMNRTTDMNLPRHGYFDHAYLFDGRNHENHENKHQAIPQAVAMVKLAMDNLEEAKIRARFLELEIRRETYDHRVHQILEECGFI